jgi:hypothetical protein
MVAHQPSTPDQIEDRSTADQREQRDEGEDRANLAHLCVEGAVVVGHVEGVTGAYEVDGDDKREVAVVRAGVALVPGVRAAALQRRVDRRGRVDCADLSVVGRRSDHMTRVDQDSLPDTWLVGDRIEQPLDAANGVGWGIGPFGVLAFEGLRVRPQRGRVVGDLPLREAVLQYQVARDADQRKRQQDGREQPQAEGKRRAIFARATAFSQPPARIEQSTAPRRPRLQSRGPWQFSHAD